MVAKAASRDCYGSTARQALLTLILFSASVLPTPVPGQERPSSVPAEVLVKFTRQSHRGQDVEAIRRGDSSARDRLDAAVKVLSTELGVPLAVKQVGSGGEVLLSVPLEGFRSMVREHLLKDRRVASVEGESLDAGDLRVEFQDGSREAKELSETRKKNGATVPPRVSRAVQAWGRELNLPLTTRLALDKGLLVGVDLKALTERLIERLKRRPDVEYAQPNLILKRSPSF